ncbi:protein kinase domain-containing protein [Curtobacterium sp. RRHDQ10]|uniref:serine/threonine-protein kinase n=1 Tax=Curtobacterium phyllosphaerae TaxID=3413379 RepID=UPI003BF412F7
MSDGTQHDDRMIGGRYRVLGTLGHGGMATVYRARDEQLGREVAVKVFRMGPVDQGERARAEAEIQALASLRHPSLVTLYDADVADADGESFLVMELVPGTDLATRLRSGALPVADVARIGAQIADALAAVHAQGIVHRDVKPANVLVEDADAGAGRTTVRAKLADFGIALLRDAARATGTGTVMGTAAYLAPEQVTAQGIDGRADVYSLGLVLLEALTGRQAFPGTAIESATARLTRPPAIETSLPVAWRTLLHTMTAMDADDRPTASEAADRLRALGRGPAADLGDAGAAPTRVLGAAAVPPVGPPGLGTDDQETTVLGRVTPPAAAPAAAQARQAQARQAQARQAQARQAQARQVQPAGPATPASGPDPAARRRRAWIWAVVGAVLVVAAVVVGLVVADGGTAPAPTESGTPSSSTPADQSTPVPSQEVPSRVPSGPTAPSEPAEPSEPSEPEQSTVPSNIAPSTGPEPSNPASNPVVAPTNQ